MSVSSEPNPIPSSHIPVKAFRTIFMWPLALDLPKTGNAKDARKGTKPLSIADAVVKKINALKAATGGLWAHVPDPLQVLGTELEAQAQAYGEFAYFHEFVQSFLYPVTDEAKEPPIHLFQRKDITKARIVLSKRWGDALHRCVELNVDRVHLHLMNNGIAMISVEVSSTPDQLVLWTDARGLQPDTPPPTTASPLMLADVLTLNDAARRAYIPYIPVSGGKAGLPSLVVENFNWQNDKGLWLEPNASNNEDRDLAPVLNQVWDQGKRFIAPFDHWKRLLPTGWKVARAGSEDITWRHVVDERMPILCWISLSQSGADYEWPYRAVSEGDWVRMCFVDPQGSDAMPYARSFLKGWEKDHCYDRFHYGPGETADGTTRYLISGYSMSAVGCGNLNGYSHFDVSVQSHMRRHYYQLMLLAQFELATLLALSGRITHAVEALEKDKKVKAREAQEAFRMRMEDIEEDFLQFVHRFRFTGLSNQLQAHELFGMLRGRMRLDEIFSDLREEITTATAFLGMREQSSLAKSASRLGTIATLATIFGLAFSFLGMNVLMDKDFLKLVGLIREAPTTSLFETIKGASWVARDNLMIFFFFLAVFSGLGLWIFAKSTGDPAHRDSGQAAGIRALLWIWGSTTGLAAIFLVSRYFSW